MEADTGPPNFRRIRWKWKSLEKLQRVVLVHRRRSASPPSEYHNGLQGRQQTRGARIVAAPGAGPARIHGDVKCPSMACTGPRDPAGVGGRVADRGRRSLGQGSSGRFMLVGRRPSSGLQVAPQGMVTAIQGRPEAQELTWWMSQARPFRRQCGPLRPHPQPPRWPRDEAR